MNEIKTSPLQGVRVIDMSAVLMGPATTQVLGDHLGGQAFVPAVGKTGYERLLTSHRRPYRTLDGYIAATPYNDKQFRAFFAAVDRADMLASGATLDGRPDTRSA